MIDQIEELSQVMSIGEACQSLDFARSTFYRRTGSSAHPSSASPALPRRSRRGLTDDEEAQIRTVLNSERFVDCSPYVVYATLLDEGEYLCSVSTMYRILRAHGEVCERRNQRKVPVYQKPELLATAPNRLWSWDISWLRGPVPGVYYYIYVILDVFSRYIVAWTVAAVESAELACALIDFACLHQGIVKDSLTLHSDRGPAMKSIPVADLLEHLGVTKSHSRPYTSDDNPYSEAQFKTMKYRPDYPDRFDSQEQACTWARTFIHWYNFDHLHSGIGYVSPAACHFGQAQQIVDHRQTVLDQAFLAHPERFVNGHPSPPQLPTEVWINQPAQHTQPQNDPLSSLIPGPEPALLSPPHEKANGLTSGLPCYTQNGRGADFLSSPHPAPSPASAQHGWAPTCHTLSGSPHP
jgi:putative transposase